MLNREMLSDIIHSKGKTYGECADTLGISANTFTKIINGQRLLKVTEMDKLIDYLEINNPDVKVSLFLH